jgi:hypothetical protein
MAFATTIVVHTEKRSVQQAAGHRYSALGVFDRPRWESTVTARSAWIRERACSPDNSLHCHTVRAIAQT